MKNGVTIAFSEIEGFEGSFDGFEGSFDGDAPRFARHLAMNVDSMAELLDCKKRLEDAAWRCSG